MAKKKTNQQEKKVQVKKKVQKRKKNTRRHVKGEIISWEELENRTGLTGDEYKRQNDLRSYHKSI